MRRPRASLWLLLALASPASAQQQILSRQAAADIIIEAVDPTGGCTGDLFSGETDDFRAPPLLRAPGMTCPYPLAGDATLRGAETGLYYILDPGFGGPPFASNMAFRQERHLDVRYFPSGLPTDNVYFVSTPTFPGQDDIANTAAPEPNKCVGDPGGPGAPDGLLNADDIICSWWTSRTTGQGAFMISRRDEPSRTWRDRSGFVDPGTGLITFAGPWTEALLGIEEGYMVSVDGVPGTENRFVITGGHDMSRTGRDINGASDILFVLDVPFHSMYVNVDEIFCGLNGVDWVDVAPPLGDPDICWPGLVGVYDQSNAETILTYDNILDGGPTDGTYVARTVVHDRVSGREIFSGPDFDLRPGEAYLLLISPLQPTTTFLSPHY